MGEDDASEIDDEYLSGDGGRCDVVDVMCAVTRGVSGCDAVEVPVLGRGKRLVVGETDFGDCGSTGLVLDGGPRLGGRRSGDLSRAT